MAGIEWVIGVRRRTDLTDGRPRVITFSGMSTVKSNKENDIERKNIGRRKLGSNPERWLRGKNAESSYDSSVRG